MSPIRIPALVLVALAVPGSAPVTFVVEASPNTTAVLWFDGRGDGPLGYCLFYGCDVTPSAS